MTYWRRSGARALEAVLEAVRRIELADQRDLELGHGDAGRRDPQVGIPVSTITSSEGAAGQDVEHVAGICDVELDVRHGRVGLRIEVDEQGLQPFWARPAARLMAVVVLPTPPFWLAMAMIICFVTSHPFSVDHLL